VCTQTYSANPTHHPFRLSNCDCRMLFPGPRFNAQATLKCLIEEHATNFVAMPLMVHAMIDQVEVPGQKPGSLRRTDVAGAAVTLEVVRLCVEKLRVKFVGCGFVMSEGTPLGSPSGDTGRDRSR
jgi:fatty-acyl-CoA synthase